MTVTVPHDNRRIRGWSVTLRQPSIARPQQRRLELVFNQLLNEPAHPLAYRGLNRIKPVVEKTAQTLGFGMRNRRVRASTRHGVVSSPARQRRMIRG